MTAEHGFLSSAANRALEVPGWGTTAPLRMRDLLKGDINPVDTSGFPLLEHGPFVRPPLKRGGGKGLIVNVLAHAGVTEVYQESLDLVSLLRDRIFPYGNKNEPDDLACVINATTGLAFWLLLKKDPQQNGEIDPRITGAAKAASGFAKVFTFADFAHMLGIVDDAIPTEEELTSTAPFLHAVHRGKFLIREKEVCPASRPEIVQFAQVLFEEPTRGINSIGQKLGLSPDDIDAAEEFGTALYRGRLEKEYLWQRLTELSDPIILTQRGFFQENRSILVNRYGANTDLAGSYMRTINFFEPRLNVALRREIPSEYGHTDFVAEVEDYLSETDKVMQ
jgi:hypothetical protein